MRDQGGAFLSTREAGEKAAEEFARLTRTPGDVILDFEGVDAATPPFLQEILHAVSKLISENQDTGRIVLAANFNEDLAATMRYVATNAKRGVVYVHGGKLDLMKERPHLAEVLQEAQHLKPFFTAPELAEKLDIKPNAATQRLRTLIEIGGAVRAPDPTAERGVRHVYRVADPNLCMPKPARRKRAAGRQ